MGERAGADPVGDRASRVGPGRGRAGCERRDERARCIDRHRERRRCAGVPRRVPGHRCVLERDDPPDRRLQADRLTRDGDQRRRRAGPARAGDVSRSLSPAVPRDAMKRPLVVKLGSGLVVDARGRPRRAVLRSRAAEIASIVDDGTPVCVVSSGAIALGLAGAGRPASLPRLQAASALGQVALQRAWQDALRPHGLDAAQMLLTSSEIGDRRAYVNIRATFSALFTLGAVPVVNENDATATDEISFGDNDALAAQDAVLLRARLLVLLTSVPGVLDDGVVIEDGTQARTATFGPGSPLGRGGMESKVAAAELAAAAGIPTVIAGDTPLSEL